MYLFLLFVLILNKPSFCIQMHIMERFDSKIWSQSSAINTIKFLFNVKTQWFYYAYVISHTELFYNVKLFVVKWHWNQKLFIQNCRIKLKKRKRTQLEICIGVCRSTCVKAHWIQKHACQNRFACTICLSSSILICLK